ncbi:MAG: hypothetical protein ACW967_00425 [Candidatus Hodarchaeales archaeon]|jgi:hypothetical protein
MITKTEIHESLGTVRRYEDFLSLKNWSVILFIFGIIDLLNSIVNLINIQFNVINYQDPLWVIFNLFIILLMILSFTYILRNYYYFKRMIIIKKNINIEKTNIQGILFIIIWFFLFLFVKGYLFDPIFGNVEFGYTSPLLFSGLLFLGIYYYLKKSSTKIESRDFLWAGIFLLILTILIMIFVQPILYKNRFGGYDDPFDFLRSIMGGESSDTLKIRGVYFINSFIVACCFLLLSMNQLLKSQKILKGYSLDEQR